MASGVTGLSSEGRVQSWDAPQGLLLEGQYATFIQPGGTRPTVPVAGLVGAATSSARVGGADAL